MSTGSLTISERCLADYASATDALLSMKPPTTVEAWQRYDDNERRLSARISERMLDLACLRPWTHILDVATGRGEPAIRAAARVAPDGWVVGTDPSADMLAMTRARANREAIRNLTLIPTSGERLEGLRNRQFNVALCRWGFMFFERPVAALNAVRSHLVPRGLLVSALWGAPECVSWWSAPRRVLAKHAPQPAISLTSPGPFKYARSESFRDDLSAAGFECEHEESVQTSIMEAATPKGLVEWCLTFGLASALKDLPDAIRRAWCRDMLAEAERHRDEDGMYRLGGTTRLVVARAT